MQITTNKRFEHRQTDDYFWKGCWMRWGNSKSNLHHNSTKQKESHKINREFKYYLMGIMSENITCGFLHDIPDWY